MRRTICSVCKKVFETLNDERENARCYNCALLSLTTRQDGTVLPPEEGDFNSALLISGEMTQEEADLLCRELQKVDAAACDEEFADYEQALVDEARMWEDEASYADEYEEGYDSDDEYEEYPDPDWYLDACETATRSWEYECEERRDRQAHDALVEVERQRELQRRYEQEIREEAEADVRWREIDDEWYARHLEALEENCIQEEEEREMARYDEWVKALDIKIAKERCIEKILSYLPKWEWLTRLVHLIIFRR